jgi:hypothetical protein
LRGERDRCADAGNGQADTNGMNGCRVWPSSLLHIPHSKMRSVVF